MVALNMRSIRLLLLCGMSLVMSAKAACTDVSPDGAIDACGNIKIGSTTLEALAIAEGCDSINNFEAWLSCLTFAAEVNDNVVAGTDGTIAGLCIQSYACDLNCAVSNPFVDDTYNCTLTVAPTAAPTAAPTSSGGGVCFGRDATVQVEHRGPVAMKDLAIGDRVLTATSGGSAKAHYEPVYAFAHHDPHQYSDFLSIYTSGTSRPLDVTPDHLLMVPGKRIPVRAGSIQVGDSVLTDGPATNSSQAVVTSIHRSYDRGLYAPLTPSGKLVVDGFVASNYVALQDSTKSSGQAYIGNGIPLPFSQHFLDHLWITPLRVLCTGAPSFFSDQCQSLDYQGLHPWASLGMDFAVWSMQQTLVGQYLLLIGYLAVFLPLYVTEHCFLALSEPLALFVSAACIFSLVVYRRQEKKVKVL